MAPGVNCEQRCSSFNGSGGNTCFACTFVFTRTLTNDGKCADLNACLLDSKICSKM
jgi:hypothetical protein